ncbi:MAG TPA: hypothetical protein VD866_17735, partial [Urbifossiella sp.]|nr:hypothetical protein [Urbifossiella sp.]
SYLTQSLRDVLDSARLGQWREEVVYGSEPGGCRSCSARAECPRCPAMVVAQHHTATAKHDPTCAVTSALAGLPSPPGAPDRLSLPLVTVA